MPYWSRAWFEPASEFSLILKISITYNIVPLVLNLFAALSHLQLSQQFFIFEKASYLSRVYFLMIICCDSKKLQYFGHSHKIDILAHWTSTSREILKCFSKVPAIQLTSKKLINVIDLK